METPTMMLAIITTEPEQMTGGGVPVFVTENAQLMQEMSFSLEKILDAAAHEVSPTTMIIVAH